MISLTIENRRVNDMLGHLKDVTGADARAVLQDQAKRLARQITNFMPPLNTGKKGSAKATGEAAVEMDLKNLITEATPNLIDEIGSRFGVTDIRTAYLTEHGGEQINLQWDHLDPTGSRLHEYHEQARDDEGRVPFVARPDTGIWSARVVAPVGTRQPEIDRTKADVGIAKASWALTGARLGDSYPAWINRHFGRVAKMSRLDQSKLNDPEQPSITFGSSAPGIGRFKRQINQAVVKRARAMVTRVATLIRLKAEGKPLPPNPEMLEVVE